MKVTQTELAGVLIVEPDVFGDHRGFFMESWNRRRYRDAGLDEDFVQDNVSFSGHGILRGLHFQHPDGQGKLVQVLRGEVYDVAVDIRRGSPSFGRWVGVTLSDENHRQLYIPPGFAHGFCVTGENALFAYKCTAFYSPASEHSLLWNDPDLGITWPLDTPKLSEKDGGGMRLRDFPEALLPAYEAGGTT